MECRKCEIYRQLNRNQTVEINKLKEEITTLEQLLKIARSFDIGILNYNIDCLTKLNIEKDKEIEKLKETCP